MKLKGSLAGLDTKNYSWKLASGGGDGNPEARQCHPDLPRVEGKL